MGAEAKRTYLVVIDDSAEARVALRFAAAGLCCAAPSGSPGVLVANFCGNDAGKLPCPVMLIPGSLSDDRLEQLS